MSESGTRLGTNSGQKTSTNIFKLENIRIFGYNDKYLLVDSGGFAFMMFEKKTDIHYVDFPFRNKVEKTFPYAKQIPFSRINRSDLQYMCQYYSKAILGDFDANSYKERVSIIQRRHNVSWNFAKILIKLPKGTNYAHICHDIREANFYLRHKPDWQEILRNDYLRSKKEVLRKLLPEDTYELLNINSAGFARVKDIIDEIFNIK